MTTLQQRYASYVCQMENCHIADMRRYGADCPNAFIPLTFEEWKGTCVTPCPLGCGREVASEEDGIHYCVRKVKVGRKVVTEREYVGTWDGEAKFFGGSYLEVEEQIVEYRGEFVASDLRYSATALDGGDPDHVELIDPLMEEGRHAELAVGWGYLQAFADSLEKIGPACPSCGDHSSGLCPACKMDGGDPDAVGGVTVACPVCSRPARRQGNRIACDHCVCVYSEDPEPCAFGCKHAPCGHPASYRFWRLDAPTPTESPPTITRAIEQGEPWNPCGSCGELATVVVSNLAGDLFYCDACYVNIAHTEHDFRIVPTAPPPADEGEYAALAYTGAVVGAAEIDPYPPLGPCFCGADAWLTTAIGLLCPDHELLDPADPRCPNCGDEHAVLSCPQIGAALMGEADVPSELRVMRAAYGSAMRDNCPITAEALVAHAMCQAEAFVRGGADAPTCSFTGCTRPATRIDPIGLPVCEECDRAGMGRLKQAIFGELSVA